MSDATENATRLADDAFLHGEAFVDRSGKRIDPKNVRRHESIDERRWRLLREMKPSARGSRV